jgi:hypothetical protein
MTRAVSRLTFLPLAAVLALAVPAAASATVRCVNMSGGDCGGGLTYTSIQGAVDDAVSGDTIRLHPQPYTESVNADAKTLTFDSPGAATIAAPDDEFALSMAHGGAVRSLTLVGGKKSDPGGVAPSAIRFASTGDFSLVLSGVHLTGGAGSAGSVDGGPGLDVSNGNNAGNDTRVSVDASTIDAGVSSAAGGDGLSFTALGGTLSVSDSFVHGAHAAGSANGLHVIGASSASVTGSYLEGDHGALIQNAAFTAVRDHFVAHTSHGFGAGLDVFSAGSGPAANRPTTATVVDSLLEAVATGNISNSAAAVAPGAATAQLTARGSTFVAEKPNTTGGAVLVQRFADGDPAASIALHNSIVRAFDGESGSADLVADRAPISADHSAFSSSVSRNGGSVPAAGSGTNIAGDPGFVSATDFSLQPGSPLVDRGDPSIVSPGELDLAGANRALDGDGDCSAAPDIGAFERPAVAATQPCVNTVPITAPASAPVISGFAATNRVFAPVAKGAKVATAARHGRKKVKRGTRFRYRLSEAAKVTITIQRKLPGRRVKRGNGAFRKTVCAKPTRKNHKKRRCTRYKRAGTIRVNGNAGANTTPFTGRFRGKALKPGRYRATIVATDAQGAKSKPKRLSLRIVRG